MLNSRKSKHCITFLSLVIGTIFLSPSSAYAEWFWISVVSEPSTGYFIEEVSPNTIGYTPAETNDPYSNKTLVSDNFMDTMEEVKDSDKCSGELDSSIQKLRQFDANEEIITPSKCGSECSPYYANPEQTMASREQLLLDLESDAQSCLVDEQEEIEEAIEEQERKEAEEDRLIEVQDAVSECDFDYFENEMTNKERMDTYDERVACKAEPEVAVEEIVEPVTLPAPETPSVITPVIAPPTPITPALVPDAVQTNPEPVVEDFDEATTTPETNTNDDTSIEESFVPSEQATEPEPKPSFFKRVINFFTSWF